MNTHIVGAAGEETVAKYLAKHKYKILQRNFRCRFGEIDIVAENDGFVVFIEVKSRQNCKFGMPREAVTFDKRRHIVATAQYWLVRNKVVGKPVRFDVAEVLPDGITLLKDAFRP